MLLAAGGALAGAILGLAAFGLSRLTGAALFILVGALAGVGAVFLLRPYIGRARLTSLKITVPQVSVLTFVVDDEARQMAWRLYIEAATRISTQPLSAREGNLREAFTSLHGLFAITRESLKAGRPSPAAVPGGHSVEYLAITMLNRELRPFLSKWHPLLHEFEQAHPSGPESKWTHDGACRKDLELVRLNIIDYTVGFGRLANVRDAEAMLSAHTM
jgi:hypothetical protein